MTMKNEVVDGKLTMTYSSKDLELVPCSEVGLDLNYFKNLALNNMLCIKDFMAPSSDLKITGVFESSLFGLLTISISKCVGTNCKPAAEIKEALKKSFFAINYVNFATKSSNYKEPVEKFPSSYYTTTSTDFRKEIQMRMVDNEVVTQSSFFGYTSPSKRSFSASERFVTDIMGISTSDSEVEGMLELNIRMDQVKIVTNRVYETAFQAFAELGGIVSIITFLAVVVSMRVSNTLLMLNLARTYESSKEIQLRSKEEYHQNSFKSAKERSSGFGLKASANFSQVNPAGKPMKSSLHQKSEVLKKKFVKSRPSILKNISEKPFEVYKHDRPKAPLGQKSQMQFVNDNKSDERKANRVEFQPREEMKQSFEQAEGLPLEENQERIVKPGWMAERESIFDGGLKGPLKVRSSIFAALSQAVPDLLSRSSVRHLSKEQLFKQQQDRIDKDINTWAVFLHSFLPFVLSEKSTIKTVVSHTERTIASRFDFLNFLQVFDDILKLKLLLLTPEQEVMFDHLKAEDVRDGRQMLLGQSAPSLRSAVREASESPDQSMADKVLLMCLGYLIEEDGLAEPQEIEEVGSNQEPLKPV